MNLHTHTVPIEIDNPIWLIVHFYDSNAMQAQFEIITLA